MEIRSGVGSESRHEAYIAYIPANKRPGLKECYEPMKIPDLAIVFTRIQSAYEALMFANTFGLLGLELDIWRNRCWVSSQEERQGVLHAWTDYH